jgi:hypothetical protein
MTDAFVEAAGTFCSAYHNGSPVNKTMLFRCRAWFRKEGVGKVFEMQGRRTINFLLVPRERTVVAIT